MKQQVFWNCTELELGTDIYVRLNSCHVKKLHEVIYWLGEQMPVASEYRRWSYLPAVDIENRPHVYVIFTFTDPEDAMMFKLAWG